MSKLVDISSDRHATAFTELRSLPNAVLVSRMFEFRQPAAFDTP